MNNYRNVSVRTTVNITDSMPEIINITCNNGSQVTLNPGFTQNVTCTVEIRDFNGGDTINGTGGSGVNVSKIFFFRNTTSDPDDNNVHYTNNSCSVLGQPNGYYINWTCGFSIWYYANNGSWVANLTVHDRYHGMSYNVSGSQNFTIQSLYAINVTDVIDFGNMFVGETSASPVQANITNFGNMRLNISIYGFGGDNETLYNALALVCNVRNLSLDTERYSINSSEAWSLMTPISYTPTIIPIIGLPQRQEDSVPVVNATYWKLYVDPASNPFGQCNGTVIFSAIAID